MATPDVRRRVSPARPRGPVLTLVGGTVFALVWIDLVRRGPITRWDHDVATVHGHAAAGWTMDLAQWLATAGSWQVTGVAACALAGCVAWWRRDVVPVVQMAGGLLLLAVLGWGTKILIGRVGPHDDPGQIVWGGAFPSGHAAAAVVIACLGAGMLGRAHRGVAAVVWAAALGWSALVGWSRLQLHVHWFSDVVAGWALGLLVVGVVLTVRDALAGDRQGDGGTA